MSDRVRQIKTISRRDSFSGKCLFIIVILFVLFRTIKNSLRLMTPLQANPRIYFRSFLSLSQSLAPPPLSLLPFLSLSLSLFIQIVVKMRMPLPMTMKTTWYLKPSSKIKISQRKYILMFPKVGSRA